MKLKKNWDDNGILESRKQVGRPPGWSMSESKQNYQPTNSQNWMAISVLLQKALVLCLLIHVCKNQTPLDPWMVWILIICFIPRLGLVQIMFHILTRITITYTCQGSCLRAYLALTMGLHDEVSPQSFWSWSPQSEGEGCKLLENGNTKSEADAGHSVLPVFWRSCWIWAEVPQPNW